MLTISRDCLSLSRRYHYVRAVVIEIGGIRVLPEVRVIDTNESKYIVFPQDSISKALSINGQYDSLTLWIASLFCNLQVTPHVVLDVGANIGAFSIPIARRILDKGEVIAFEPQQTVYYQLCGNIVLNRLNNVNAHNLALSDKSGTLQLPETNFHNNLNNGGLSFEPIYNVHNGIAVKDGVKKKIEAITLDSVEIENRVSLVKIDVEGFELKVISGGFEFLRFHSYPPLLFEAWPYEWFADEKRKLLTVLEKELGYLLTEYDPQMGNFCAQHPQHPYYFDVHREVVSGRLSWVRKR